MEPNRCEICNTSIAHKDALLMYDVTDRIVGLFCIPCSKVFKRVTKTFDRLDRTIKLLKAERKYLKTEFKWENR